MNNDKMRAALDAAKAYKAEQIARVEASIAEIEATLARAEAQLEAWRTMIPFDVQRVMAEDAQRQAASKGEEDRVLQRESKHAAALREAYAHGKGLLPPEAESKSTSFGIAGALLFGTLATIVLKAFFNVHAEFWLALAGAFGGIGGLFAGFAFFNANFVVDDSLERGVFAHFTAYDTVRRTYFKRGQD